MSRAEQELFQSITSPERVAFVGASSNPERIGGRPLAYCLEGGFQGEMLPVNPNKAEVQGLKAYPSIEEISGHLDFAVIAVPAASVIDAVRSVATKGAKAAMIFAGGFAETGEQGAILQQELIQVAQRGGIRLIGPNCIGLINCRNRFNATFTGTARLENPNPGGFTIIGQSGSYAAHTYLTALKYGARPGLLLATGNEADLGVADFISMAVEDPNTDVIGCYSEGVRDGAKLISALDAARQARKPVLFMKVGRSAVGAAAAMSHTAALTGEDAVFGAILAQYGAERVQSTEHMADIAKAAIPKIYPSSKNLAVMTLSGGAGIIMADVAEDEGIEMPKLPGTKADELEKLNPMASMRNPFDVTAHVLNDVSSVAPTFKALLEGDTYDAVICYWSTTGLTPGPHQRIISEVEKATSGYGDKLLIHCLNPIESIAPSVKEKGIPVFEDPARAVRAVASLMRLGIAFERTSNSVNQGSNPVSLPDGPVNERVAKQILSLVGLPMVIDQLVTTAEEARIAAADFGGNVAIKVVSPDIQHKSDVGGVALNVTPADVSAVVSGIFSDVATACPDARIDGVLVSPMVGKGVDCILGSRQDPVFGSVVVFGLGGIFTETLGDVSIRKAPVDEEQASKMISELRGRALLEGARGRPSANKDVLVKAIVSFSVFVAECGADVESMEINPLRAMEDKALGLDALIELRN